MPANQFYPLIVPLVLALVWLGSGELATEDRILASVGPPGRILIISLNSSETMEVPTNETVASLAYDAARAEVYWTVGTKIFVVNLGKLGLGPVRVLSAPCEVHGISYDWIAQNIYFTCLNEGSVGVCNRNGTACRVLVTEAHAAFYIALHPTSGTMYWTTSGAIRKSGMDGSSIRTILSSSVFAIVVDHLNARLYWTNNLGIHSSDLNGGDLQVVLPSYDGAMYPWSVDVLADKVYWQDMGTFSIKRCDKIQATTSDTVFTAPAPLEYMAVFHGEGQPKDRANDCGEQYYCSTHLCVLTPTNSSHCLCPEGHNLYGDGSTCTDWIVGTAGKKGNPLDFTKTDVSALQESAIVVGATMGAFVLVLIILLVSLFYKLRRARKFGISPEEIEDFVNGMRGERAQGGHDFLLLPYNRELEIPEADIELKKTVLGSGAFGKVLDGVYQGRPVAIKTVTNCTDPIQLRAMLSEVKVLSCLGKHRFLVELIGAVTGHIKNGTMFLVLELCSNGSAINFIRERREKFLNLLSDDHSCYKFQFEPTLLEGQQARQSSNTVEISTFAENLLEQDYVNGSLSARFHGADRSSGSVFSSIELIRWSYEVAAGMEFVASKKIFHGDLAARNILLTDTLQAKISDFGLSRELSSENYAVYIQKKCPLPVRWMAIESLRDLTFSIHSDVWSFGVLMWEMFSLGAVPYTGYKWNFKSWKLLRDGFRMDRPEYASTQIYSEMLGSGAEE